MAGRKLPNDRKEVGQWLSELAMGWWHPHLPSDGRGDCLPWAERQVSHHGPQACPFREKEALILPKEKPWPLWRVA